MLIAWLLFELARFVVGDVRYARVDGGSVQVPSPEPPVAARTPPQQQQPALRDDADVEQAVRDRLYGRHRRRDA